MSLRVFHIVFIIASIILSIWVGVWAIRFYQGAGGMSWLAMAVIFFALAVALVLYGVRVWEKLKEV